MQEKDYWSLEFFGMMLVIVVIAGLLALLLVHAEAARADTNPAKTKISLSSPQKAVKAGQVVILKGVLTDMNDQVIAYKPVIIRSKVLKESKKKVKGKTVIVKKWVRKTVAKAVTDSHGDFQIKAKQSIKSFYRAHFNGDADYKGAASGLLKVNIKKVTIIKKIKVIVY